MRFSVLLIAALAWPAAAQESPSGPSSADPEIQKMVSQVSSERMQRTVFVLGSFRTRHILSDPSPSGDEIGGAGAWIRAEFERASAPSRGRLRVELQDFRQPAQPPLIPRPLRLSNIVATLPSARPETSHGYYILCAHYDTRVKDILDHHSLAPGADDDGSGVAAVLEAARALCPYDFGASLVFLITTAEEQNLNGSAAWADLARRNGLNVAGVIDLNRVGNDRGPSGRVEKPDVRLFAGGGEDDPSRELARAIRDLALLYTPSLPLRIIFRAGGYAHPGDQMSFIDRGWPAVLLTEGFEDYRRLDRYIEVRDGRPFGDTPDSLDYAYLGRVGQLAVAAFAGLGRAPAAPKSVVLDLRRREHAATLRWAAGNEPDLAGYRVVWRETTTPFWEEARDFGADVTQARLPGLNPDDLIFGVEAFDSTGHVSPAAVAVPSQP